jgi:hypothetical protein
VVAKLGHCLFSPFFLLSTKYFLAVFFLNVQVVRMEDLHRLQFLTRPALNIHILFTSVCSCFEKNRFPTGCSARGQKETLRISIRAPAYKRAQRKEAFGLNDNKMSQLYQDFSEKHSKMTEIHGRKMFYGE